MARLLTAFLCCSVWLQLAASQATNFIDQYFLPGNEAKTPEGLQCSRLNGSATTCLACYTCDDDRIKQTKKGPRIHYLTLRDSNCTENQVCCKEYDDLVARKNENCGKNNPEGNPLRRRPSLRSVLEMEYPWRAWVYSFDNEQPLCAATYINMGVNALVTTASCVRDHQPSALSVKFTRTQQRPDRVKNIYIHDSFKKRTGGNDNDIAILTLTKKSDLRVLSVCLPSSGQTRFGSSCVIVSESETYINTVIPRQSRCKTEVSGVDFEGSVMCTFATKGDYVPQHGAGLFCLDEQETKPTYVLQGFYQDGQTNPRLSVYTNVTAFSDWIYKTTSTKSGIHYN